MPLHQPSHCPETVRLLSPLRRCGTARCQWPPAAAFKSRVREENASAAASLISLASNVASAALEPSPQTVFRFACHVQVRNPVRPTPSTNSCSHMAYPRSDCACRRLAGYYVGWSRATGAVTMWPGGWEGDISVDAPSHHTSLRNTQYTASEERRRPPKCGDLIPGQSRAPEIYYEVSISPVFSHKMGGRWPSPFSRSTLPTQLSCHVIVKFHSKDSKCREKCLNSCRRQRFLGPLLVSPRIPRRV
jgi:hypothetical protein